MKTSSLIEDKRKDKRKDKVQRAYIRRNPKMYIPLVSLLLWHKMVTVSCFIILASSLATVVSEAVSKTKIWFWRFLKILYPATCKRFVIII